MNILTVVLILLSMSCSQKNITQENFDWLLGSWKRTNDKEGSNTFEHWTKNSYIEYLGLGYTLQNSDTIFKEHLRLIKVNEDWIFEVRGVNENPTLFPLTNHTENSFISENKINDFPNKIEYSGFDNVLLAKISGGETEILFSFEKIWLE